jgi:hypothetical protein
MSLNTTPPTAHSRHASLLASLYTALLELPTGSLRVSTINYALFPLTSVLRQSSPADLPDSFLEAAFRVLSHLVQQWKQQEGGMDVVAWEQLWRFTTACIAPSVGKGKEKERSQDVQLEAVVLLTALLGPIDAHPNLAMREKFGYAKSPLMPTLFQTITLLLSTCSPDPPYLPLQLGSLRLLRQCIRYLAGQHRVLAAILPGTVSAMSKLVLAGGKGLKGDVAAEVAGVVQEVIVQTLNDEDLRGLGLLRTKLDDLSQLGDDVPSSAHEPETPQSSSGREPFPPLSASYLSFTSTQLLSTIPTILSLSSHANHTARLAAGELAYSLVSECAESLSLVRPCLITLLHLSNDEFDLVRNDALAKLETLISASSLQTDLIDILSSSLSSLPRLITSQQDAQAQSTARLITALARIDRRGVMAELLGPNGKVERWGWSLLSCLEFGRPSGSYVKGQQAISDGGLPDFPQLPLRHVESESTIRSLSIMLITLGEAGGHTALHSVEHFLLFAKAHRGAHMAKAVSAIWVSERLLSGIARGEENGIDGKVGKATRKMAREAARLATVLDEDVEDEEMPNQSEDLVPIERTKGLDDVVTLLDKKPLPDSHAANTTRRLHVESQRLLLDCLSLSLLSTSSRILGTSFRQLLLTSLYTLLSHLGSQDMIGDYAEIALSHVAYNTGYASVQNLVLDNVDYVVNVVSQRLTYRRLDSQAPLVLISMIRLVGDEIVPMVHDVVDEIFDALDDYHGYEALATSLLAVLITLIDVMKAEVDAAGISPERIDKKAEMNRMGGPPEPVNDFAKFSQWYEERSQRNREQVETVLRRTEERFKKAEVEEQPQPEEEEDRPTRSQEVAKAILSKSVYFLTHPSPFLRARVLALIARATPVLASANREADLLPSIDQAWGGILNRLDDSEPYVVTEAAEAIASLCENVGDFMSRRILDYAWPRMKALLDKQRILDDKSALARRGLGTETSYSVSHRLHSAVLRTAKFIAQEVPVNDTVLWEMMVVFRWCLDKRVHADLQARSMELYRALGRRDGDALWVCLSSTISGEGVWGYLQDAKLDIAGNAGTLLQEV